MRKDPFEKKVESKVDIDYSFAEIKSKINIDIEKTESNKKFNFKRFIPALSFSMIFVVIFAISFNGLFNPNDSSSSPAIPQDSSNDITSNEEATSVGISDSIVSVPNNTFISESNFVPGENEPGDYGDIKIINKEWEKDYVYYEESSGDTSIVPPWNEKTIMQKFGYFSYNNLKYSSFNIIQCYNTDSKYIGDKIDDIVIFGYDEYEEVTHSTNAELFEIKGVDKDCSLAVKFEEDPYYYPYSNNYYDFTSLDDLFAKLNLSEYISFGRAFYDYNDENGSHFIRFDNFDDDFVWDNLLYRLDYPNMYYGVVNPISNKSFFTIGVNIDALGIKNIYIGVDDYGNLQTNILGMAKGFALGKQTTFTFINYIINNVNGYEIVYES